MRNHLSPLFSSSSDWAANILLRMVDKALVHFCLYGGGTSSSVLNWQRAQSHAPTWSILDHPSASSGGRPGTGPGTTGLSQSRRLHALDWAVGDLDWQPDDQLPSLPLMAAVPHLVVCYEELSLLVQLVDLQTVAHLVAVQEQTQSLENAGHTGWSPELVPCSSLPWVFWAEVM